MGESNNEQHDKVHNTNGNPAKKIHRHLTEPTIPGKILVFLLIIASLLVIATLGLSLVANSQQTVKANQYQAVFLTNGQVYFGKLSSVNSSYAVLKDVYYLQQDQNVQANQNQNNQQSNVSLVKLGNELHGPEDQMYVERDKVIFWENLKDSGKVVQAIKQNQKK